ncbi:MAG: hypothetical protein A2X59_08450 [Nitrospirae bacterium GWC2_42_7]|nr:MAG: hypothetical protein A2X59_08450 [Nitrospirae bacterium GWC2_42_7]
MSKGKILVIDDEEIIRTSCLRILSPEGYEIKTAGNGQDGLKMLEEETFDLVLVDLKMPGMDGIEVQKEIRSRWPETKVSIITGYQSFDSEINDADKLIAAGFIEKSFTPDILVATVEKILEEK